MLLGLFWWHLAYFDRSQTLGEGVERRGGGGRGEVGRERREKREEEVVVPNLTAIECVPRRPSLTVLGEVSVEHRAEAVT